MGFLDFFRKKPKLSEETKSYFNSNTTSIATNTTTTIITSDVPQTTEHLVVTDVDDIKNLGFMFKFDRAKFFNGYRKYFGPMDSDLVNSLDTLLNQIEKDERFRAAKDVRTPRRQLAYCLATFKWETAHTFKPIKEYGGSAYFNRRYGPQTKVGKQLGNIKAGDGARFCGRGFVQLTGRSNYFKAGKFVGVDLINNPEKACNPDIAYRIAVEGMLEGWFTGKRLSHYFADGKLPQWEQARRIINGMDKASKIASIARQFDEILVVSLV